MEREESYLAVELKTSLLLLVKQIMKHWDQNRDVATIFIRRKVVDHSRKFGSLEKKKDLTDVVLSKKSQGKSSLQHLFFLPSAY